MKRLGNKRRKKESKRDSTQQEYRKSDCGRTRGELRGKYRTGINPPDRDSAQEGSGTCWE